MKKISAVLCLLLLASGITKAHNMNDTDAFDLARAYGYVHSQELVLDQIKKKYPSLLADRVSFVSQWERRFPKAKEKITNHLQCFGISESDLIAAWKRNDDYDEIMKASRLSSEAEAKTRLAFFKQRINQPGDFDEKIFKIIDDAVFNDDPEDEFLINKVEYSTANHPKAQGLDIRLYVPHSWKAAEGRRPHIVQKWSKWDEGMLAFTSLLIGGSEGENIVLDKPSLNALIQSGEAWSYLGDYTLLEKKECKIITIDGEPALLVSGLMEAERVDQKLYMELYYILFSVKGKLANLNFQYSSVDRKKVEALARKHRVLRNRIISSIYLPQLY